MGRYHEVKAVIECPDGADSETVLAEVVKLAESKGWFCAGMAEEIDRDGKSFGMFVWRLPKSGVVPPATIERLVGWLYRMQGDNAAEDRTEVRKTGRRSKSVNADDILELLRCALVNCDNVPALGLVGIEVVKFQIGEAIKALEAAGPEKAETRVCKGGGSLELEGDSETKPCPS